MRKSIRFQVSGFRLVLSSIFLIVIALNSCNSRTKKAETKKLTEESGPAKFVFSEDLHNFGPLTAGEVVSFTFIFRNEGNETLRITDVDSGCGCMEVNIPEKTIEPGKEGQIEVIYNSAGEVGRQLKTITIFSNAEENKKEIYIKANVTNEVIELNS